MTSYLIKIALKQQNVMPAQLFFKCVSLMTTFRNERVTADTVQ